ncbi:MAG TPA: protein kinase, partial [Chthoniobacterales bacterium]
LYLAPEVLRGEPADTRSDIFSLGCVLHEMITGRRAFEGKSQISVASAILEKEVEPVTKIQPAAPAALDHVVQDCLAKDPEDRWQSAADIARELRWIAAGGSGVHAAIAGKPRRIWQERALWAAALVALLAAVLWLGLRQGEEGRTLRSFLPPPAEMTFDFTGDFSGPPVLKADGTAVAYCARTMKERDSIYVQSLTELAPKKIEGTEGAAFPFWSSDGKYLGFFADGHLKKIPAAGGPVTILAETPNPRGGAWNQDNVIIYEPDYRDTLWRVSAAGGTPERLTKFDTSKHTTHRWPQFLPDGKHFLFFATNHSGDSGQGIYFGTLADGSYKHVLDSDSGAQYASGYLLFHLQSQLLAQKFDASTGKTSGEPMTVANLAEYDTGTWHTSFTVSQNGLLLYEPGSKTLGTDLFWMDRSGKTLGKVSERAFYKGSGRISPDGKRLAVSMGDPQADILVLDFATGSRTRLTFGGATHLEPSWSADGQRVVYTRQNGTSVVSGTSLRARTANGGGQEEVLMESNAAEPITLLTPQFSPDGRYLVHTEQSGPSITGIWALPLTGDKKPFA